MSRPDPNDPNGSTRVGRDTPASGTATGADVTSRMSGTSEHHAQHAADRHDQADRHDDDGSTATHERYEERVKPAQYKSAKTSAAAAFALVFGLAALFCALTGILAPAAVLFGVIGIIVGIAGLKKAKLPGVTGRGVAIGGLVTAVLGLLLGGAVVAGAAVYVNEQGLDRLQQQIDNARTGVDVPGVN
jgi:hypothetical protein